MSISSQQATIIGKAGKLSTRLLCLWTRERKESLTPVYAKKSSPSFSDCATKFLPSLRTLRNSQIMEEQALSKLEGQQLAVVDMHIPDKSLLAITIRKACIESGFFYLVNHGIDQRLIDEVFVQSKRFFDLSLDEKMTVSHDLNHRGYTPMAEEILDPLNSKQGDTKEGYYIGWELSGDDPLSVKPLHGPNQWPSEGMKSIVMEKERLRRFESKEVTDVEEFNKLYKDNSQQSSYSVHSTWGDLTWFYRCISCNSVAVREIASKALETKAFHDKILHTGDFRSVDWLEGSHAEVLLRGLIFSIEHSDEQFFLLRRKLGHSVASLIALALDLDGDFFQNMFTTPMVALRLLHYAAEFSSPEEGKFGCGAHSDYGLLTFLATDSNPGLQICKEKDAMPRVWDDVVPMQGAFIVNLGDMLERWTNGLFRSTLHRVLSTGVDRYSVPVFYEPNFDTLVECLPTCCSPSNPPKYPPIISGDHLLGKYIDTHSGYNATAKPLA